MEHFSEPVRDAIYAALGRAPTWTFFEFNSLPVFTRWRRRRLPTLVGLTISEPVAPDKIAPGLTPTKLPMGKLFYPTSLGVQFGYVFELPNFRTVVNGHMFTSYRPDTATDKFEDVRLVFQNSHINVFFSEDGALLANFRDRYRFFAPAFLRGGH